MVDITFDCLIQSTSLHIIQIRQVAVKHHTQSSNLINMVFDDFNIGLLVYDYFICHIVFSSFSSFLFLTVSSVVSCGDLFVFFVYLVL